MAAGSVDGELDRDGALLGHAESGDACAVRVRDAREALVDDELDTVLSVALLDELGEGEGTAAAANLFVVAVTDQDRALGLKILLEKLLDRTKDTHERVLAVAGTAAPDPGAGSVLRVVLGDLARPWAESPLVLRVLVHGNCVLVSHQIDGLAVRRALPREQVRVLVDNLVLESRVDGRELVLEELGKLGLALEARVLGV